jgi:DNA-binding NarL/FixJ family response regulator
VRVVVADNDADALELVATDLRLEGHDVVGLAADGDEAIRLLAESTPDVLVVDYRMAPGPNGLTVARTVRAAQPSVRVILYSNYRDQRLVAEAERIGAQFLPKGNLRALRRAVTG